MHWSGIGATLAVSVTLGLVAGCDDEPLGLDDDLPPADGAELWSYVNEQGYQEAWDLWPGRGELYEGTDPHGMLLTTYVNDRAVEALTMGAAAMPAGAIVVKENYMPDGTLVAVTTMYKVQGFNPDANDWFWLKNDPVGVIEVEGAVAECIGCHGGAADFDYLWLRQQDESR